MTSESRKHDSLLVTHLPSLRYLTGFSGSAGCALLTPRLNLFFTDFRYHVQAIREVKGFDVRFVNGGALEGCCRYINARRLKTGVIGYDGDHLTLRQFQLMKKLLKGLSFLDSSGEIEQRRQVKKSVELRRLRQAAAMADLAFAKLLRSKVVGRSEKQVAWLLESAMREAGSGPMPFEIIVASGPRSALPHGVAGNRIIGTGELVVVDLGASVDGYCSDATRTFTTGPLPPRLTEIYRIVQEAQQLALAGVRDGVACAEIDRLARDHISAAGFGEAFGHSLGHGVGLESHEAPVLSGRSKETLKAGMTVTIEPGIYLERLGGVRIEDTVLVGARGAVPLTKFPRELKILR